MKTPPRWLPACLLFAFVFGAAYLSVHSADTWLHLASGRWIVEHRHVPLTDAFSYTHRGRPWHPDDWLGDAVMSEAARVFGERGLVAFKATLVAAGAVLIVPLVPGASVLMAGLLALAAAASWRGLSELPSCFDFVLLALFLRLLAPKTPMTWRLLGSITGLELLWANLHPAGAALGLVVVAIKTFKAETRRRPDRGRWLALLGCALLAAACRPGGGWTSLWLLLHAASLPADVPAVGVFSLHGLFVVAGAAAAWVCLLEDFFLGLTAATFLGLSIVAPGWGACAAFAATPAIALALGHFVKAPALSVNSGAGLAAGMLVLFLAYFGFVSLPLSEARGYSTRQTPQGALEFLAANHVSGRMFNDLESSAYLVWRGGEERPVFADTRELYDDAFLADVRAWPQRWKLLDDVYQFDYAVVENRSGYPCAALDADPAWALAYWDDAAAVYLRRQASNQRTVSLGAFSRVRPNSLFDPLPAEALTKKEAPALLSELDRAMAYAPRSASPLLLKSLALTRLGESDKSRALARLAATRPFWKPEQPALLGLVLEERGDAVGALNAYRQGLRLASSIGERTLGAAVSARMAALHLKNGEKRQAVRSLREAVRLDPANAEAAAALRSLSAN
ncbi:MAG: hypothetical protein HY059_18850 [Proteobacteria bacterium]|nr:hypothetical protein [Pseudomonadota bacterium]